MKKAIILITATIMMLSLAACSSPAVQEDAAQKTATTESAEKPTATLEPKIEPTPTPEPTLSEEEIVELEALEEYNLLKHYYETYGDTYALFLINDLVDEELIPKDLLLDFDDPYYGYDKTSVDWLSAKMVLQSFEIILNGRSESPTGMFDYVMNGVADLVLGDVVFISAFDTQEARNKVEEGIQIINAWFDDPNEQTLAEVEKLFFRDDLLPGEVYVFWQWYLLNPRGPEQVEKNGKLYDRLHYSDAVFDEDNISIGDIIAENYYALLKSNEMPNDPSYIPKDWITNEDIEDFIAENEVEN